jgi:hypothetical protein
MHLGALIAAALVAVLTQPAPAAPSVDHIVARHIEARGGYEKLKAVQTIRMTRTVATAFSDLRVVVYRKRPGLYRLEQGPLNGSAPLVPRVVNAEGAWDTGAGGKVSMRSPALAAEARDLDADFDGLLVDWQQKGHAVTLDGIEQLPSGRTYKLRVKTKGGAERTIYLDADTYLERRHAGVLNLPDGRRFDVVIDFGNYRDVGGVQFPHDITEERTGKEPVQSLVTYTEHIEINVPIDDALFAPPKQP